MDSDLRLSSKLLKRKGTELLLHDFFFFLVFVRLEAFTGILCWSAPGVTGGRLELLKCTVY